MSFYITLPSDSSLNFFPENKISHYITRLPSPIELKGDWEVGLVEFIFPHTWHNVNSKNNTIGFNIDDLYVGHHISEGYYHSVSDILEAIALEGEENKVSFRYSPASKRVRITLKNGARVCLKDGLAQMLGFEPTNIQSDDHGEIVVESPYIADPSADYRVLMVYTNIVESQIVGDVLAPLLRIVNISGQHGETICAQYERPHYLPINCKFIDSIEIAIRKHSGELVPFERGRSYVKLHFRQKYLA